MDVEFLSRIQFAVTVGFHFLFPPITIGLAWLLVLVETRAWRTGLDVYDRMGRFYGKLLGITFAVGVATGIPMEFQFGMNWSGYSKFVGDIFGAPLAAEAVLAFFLESGFLGLYLFGRKRVSKGWHVFAILMVAVGATLSAFWILVANSWMQTPAGYTLVNGRAELTSFYDAVFTASMIPRFVHTMMAALVAGSFFLAGIAAFLVWRDRNHELGRRALKVSVPLALLFSILVAFPSGHRHAQQVARTQPEKFAAIEGLYTSQTGAPLVMFAVPFTRPPELKANVEIPGMLSWLAFGSFDAPVRGLDEFPEADRPPLWVTFVSFHNMVLLGMWFMLIMFLATVQLWRGKLFDSRKLLVAMLISIPLPLISCQFGWVAAEVGRQPWIVYGVMRTADAYSPVITAPHVLFSFILFSLIYLMLGALYVLLVCRKVSHELHAPTSRDKTPPPPVTFKEMVPA